MSNGEDLRPPGEQPESLSQSEANTNAGSESREPDALEKAGLGGIVDQAIKVVTDPAGFYQSMPKSGGYSDPLVFLVVMAVASGVISAILSVFGIGVRGAMVGGFGAIVLIPIFAMIFSFVGAAIFYVIWKLMGSDENYETAYRCTAYSAAAGPPLTILGMIPAVGSIASAVWPMALMAIASIYVHSRNAKLSWSVFGALTLFLVAINLAAERQAGEMNDSLDNMRRMMEEQSQ